jgi:hypothetical protein
LRTGVGLRVQIEADVDITAHIIVTVVYHLGPLPIHVKGFEDTQTGALITNKFRTGILDPSAIERGLVPGWTRIEDPDNLSVRPFMRLSYSDVCGDHEEGETTELTDDGPTPTRRNE